MESNFKINRETDIETILGIVKIKDLSNDDLDTVNNDIINELKKTNNSNDHEKRKNIMEQAQAIFREKIKRGLEYAT